MFKNKSKYYITDSINHHLQSNFENHNFTNSKDYFSLYKKYKAKYLALKKSQK